MVVQRISSCVTRASLFRNMYIIGEITNFLRVFLKLETKQRIYLQIAAETLYTFK